MPKYRLTVTKELEITADDPLSWTQIDEIASHVRWADERVAIRGGWSEVTHPSCVDVKHRRNSIDHEFYACGADPDDAIHWTIEACEEARMEVCSAPQEHHPYVSPGWDAPA